MGSEEARDLRTAMTLTCSANPSGNRNSSLGEVQGGFQEVGSKRSGQGVQAQAEAIGVGLNPDASRTCTHTCYPSTWEAEAGGSYV